ncbi:MAG: MarR family transcriptional regulator [Clostridia bacterium]|nr:MarR family transcriptional regulator [Clostridia bacterium]
MNKYYALNYISKIDKLYKNFIEESLKESGIEDLAVSDGNVIAVLYNTDGLTMKEIGERVNRTKSTISQSIDKLEKTGYVQRKEAPYDKRMTIVDLTDKGKEIKSVFNSISEKVINHFFQGFDEDMIELFMIQLQHILSNFSE